MKPFHKRIAYTALLLSLSLIIGTIEHSLPPVIPALPFLRLGFSNIIVLFALIVAGAPSAFIIAALKSALVPLFVGNPVMILYSLPSSLLSLTAALLLVRFLRAGLPAVSVTASIVHNFSQLSVAAVITGTAAVFAYAPYLFLTASLAGLVTGVITYFAVRYVPIIK